MAGSYMDGFAQSIEVLSRQVYNRRLWFSDNWTDTETGKGKEIKMLEYACGPGAVSAVCMSYLHGGFGADKSPYRLWLHT